MAGSAAGFIVDLCLFPIDTIKTRLQSSGGLSKTGGFQNIYGGATALLLGSMPSSAMFFITYENTKSLTSGKLSLTGSAALASTLGETVGCMVRVPTEIIKQRGQTDRSATLASTFRTIVRTEGIYGFYRGYLTTLLREIPFSLLQFPVWEVLKLRMKHYNISKGRPSELTALQAAICGCLAGGFAGALTTPLDVAKTRIMLAQTGSPIARGGTLMALKSIHKQSGYKGLFRGLLPRVFQVSIGGAIFLGVYEKLYTVIRGWRL